MWDDRSERDRAGNSLERGIERVRRDHGDQPDSHVPGVEPLKLLEVAEPSEKREEGRHLPGVADDPRASADWQGAREIAFPPSAGEVGDRVDVRDLAQGPELG